MLKSFFRDSVVYTFANLLTKGIGFLMLPIYTAYFAPAEFGVIDLLLVTGNILSVLIGLELHQAVARFFPDSKSVDEKRKLVSTAFWVIAGCYVLVGIPAIVFAPQIARAIPDLPDRILVIRLAILSYGANFLYLFASAQLRWQLRSLSSLASSLVYTFVAAGGAVVILKFTALRTESIFIAQFAAAVLAGLFAYFASRDYYGFLLDRKLLRQMLGFSLPLIASTLTVYAMLYVDRFVINAYLTPEDLGLYSYAYRIATVASLLTTGCQTAISPLIYNHYREAGTPRQIARLFHYFAAAALGLVALLWLTSPVLTALIGAAAFKAAAPLIPWIAISILSTGFVSFTPGLFLEKKTWIIWYLNFFGFLLNLGLCFGLVGYLGVYGAVYATAISSTAYFVMYCALGQRYYFIPFLWTRPRDSRYG